ncbi:Mo-dependent nitrogenase C-terminal domain-containing protein [Nostoc sp. FACHB-87]|uniref:Mo-dependent nitrogenase C-terminal domain-containing protein n=1 Tax=Nostocales TaxID=1161 RepID=UPI001681E546|nr:MULTISPECIES: Mo-dependent nitrogenase C-terminal domain-containing protein [Nostocales]MBD2452782.1 Mo-dependent nitrogenase C-terminal domain-containing protein [Nostoc sp. FACHB-87]MBD2473713.1 Mo-dependent nitrogenase C-terminal domain-containing protein [Anabaena sp. FACHB-83]MBD2486379.1 Mo-dependent nitrogenase C-terminal domain-containing protein [Aulosira sp. FACHB-615]
MGLSNQFQQKSNFLTQLRHQLDVLEIRNDQLARILCKLIPAHCPFERTVSVLGRKLFHIPPLCKLNPFYEQVVSLRFKCLMYLADECGEDVTKYC